VERRSDSFNNRFHNGPELKVARSWKLTLTYTTGFSDESFFRLFYKLSILINLGGF
jgi:hypothetical protein